MREIKHAFNVLLKNKLVNSMIVIGLAIGITSALLVMMFVHNQLGYDKYVPQADMVYRVTGNNFTRDKTTANQPAVFYDIFKAEIPAIDNSAGIMQGQGYLQMRNLYSEQKFWVVDTEALAMFDIKVIEGDKAHPLLGINNVMLSTTKALELFGSEDPIGQVVQFSENEPLIVSAVFEPLPTLSHFHADILMSPATFKHSNTRFDRYSSWGCFMFYIYLKLKPDTDVGAVEQTLGQLWKQHAKDVNKSWEAQFELQPIKDVYLRSAHMYPSAGLFEEGSYATVVSFTVVGLLILVISCFNFINLSMAQLSSQLSASAMQKILGASNAVVVRHLFIQVAIIVFAATIVSLISVFGLMPYLTSPGIPGLETLALDTPAWGMLLLIILAIFLTVALVPAWRLSKIKAVDAFRRGLNPMKISSQHRLMVISQYTISAVLIISTIIINKQLTHLRQANVGFDRENILIVNNPWGEPAEMDRRYHRMVEGLKKLPGIVSASGGMNIPTGGIFNWCEPVCKAAGAAGVKHTGMVSVDYNYFETLGCRLLYGRGFSPDFPSDETVGLVVNKTFCDQIGIANPVGMEVTRIWDGPGRQIIGVIDDIRHHSLHQNNVPVIYLMKHDFCLNSSHMIVKLRSDNLVNTCKEVESLWYKVVPDMKYDAFFLDNQFNSQYKSEEATGKVLTLLTIIAVVLCSMGLLGVSLFYIHRKSREIGIRKVNGATSLGIMLMICTRFLKWVLVSSVIAVPVAWYIMARWLESFSVKTEISWWVFLLACLLVMFIALITVGGQSLWASIQNPVKVLRND